jgi:chromosome partitioning protein
MVIAVTNLKGGVGKTTIATNLAVSLAHLGHEVCILDTDLGQQSALDWSGLRCEQENLPNVTVLGAKARQLNKEVAILREKFDFVIIDGTPQLSELADRTILATDHLLIPLTPSIYDYRGFENFLERFEKVQELKQASGGNVEAYVVLNRVVSGTNVSKEIRTAVAEYDVQILNRQLVNRVAYADAASEGKGVIEFRDAKAASEMRMLTNEVLKIITE